MAYQPRTQRPDLSIVIPALNEAHRIGDTLEKLASFIKVDPLIRTLRVEVIVVIPYATDATYAIASSYAGHFRSLTVLQPGEPIGKGRDVRYGVLRSHGKAVLFMDADLATPLWYIPVFYDRCHKGADIVAGTRNLSSHHPQLKRRIVSHVGNVLFRIVSGVWIEDSQCGFKMFTAAAAHICFDTLAIEGWGFDMEVLAIAHAKKLTIECVKLNDWRSVPGGGFDNNLARNSLRNLADLTYILVRRLNRQYLR